MAEGWQMLDAGFPSVSKDEPAKQQVEKILNYLLQMKQGMQITLQAMDASLRKITNENKELKERIEKLESRVSVIEKAK